MREGDQLSWRSEKAAYSAPCPCGGTHTIWQYGGPWVINNCGRCGLPPVRPQERRWRAEATRRGDPDAKGIAKKA